MIKKIKYLSLFILVLTTNIVLGQKEKESKFLLGISVDPIIPNNMIQNNDVHIRTDSLNYKLLQRPALSFGMDIRYGFHERWSLHTGINYSNRKFNIDVYEDDSIYVDTTLKFISYEIPVYISGYVKLTDYLYLDGNFGLSMDFYPTNISVPHVYGKRYHWAQFAVIGGTGLELRTERSGYFYLGMSYKAHFHDMLYILFYRDNVIGESDESFEYSGNYFSINIKYYLP